MGKMLQDSHNFQTGLSSITGRNETGKSFRLEMIRFALFGTAALRAEAKAYVSVEAEVDFEVEGKSYNVKRTLKKADLKSGTDNVATGVSPVNKAIIKILGYDLEVFDIGNACLQGEIEAMTDKKPTERKQMVDRTIGLDAIDDVIKKVADDVSATKAAIETLNQKVIQIFEAPVKPEGFNEAYTIDTLEGEINGLEKDKQRLSYLKGMVEGLKCSLPTPPQFDNVIEESIDDLQIRLNKVEADYASIQQQKINLKNYDTAIQTLGGLELALLNKYIDEDYSTKHLNYARYRAAIVPAPTVTQEEIDFIRDSLKIIQHKKNDCVDVTCPSCSYTFAFDKFNGGIDCTVLNQAKFDELYERLNKPTEKDLLNYERTISNYENFLKLTPVEAPNIHKIEGSHIFNAAATLNSLIKQNFNSDETRVKLMTAEQDYIRDSQELKNKITLKRFQDSQREIYRIAMEAYHKYEEAMILNAGEIETLEKKVAILPELQNQLSKHRLYNDAVIKYQVRQEAQAEALKTKADLEANLILLSQVKKSLTELKPKVKTYLLPSLNSVASQLLSEMTDGKRNKIVVSEDFEIEVDGQHVKTLSGSGKAVANLAVRIGLGMVLTNKKFSVFLADEIDAAMDSERATYTAQCLRNLTNTIGQIILVSHKQPDADHQITL